MSTQQESRHRATPATQHGRRTTFGTAGEHRVLITSAGIVFLAALILALVTLPSHRRAASSAPDYLAALDDSTIYPDQAMPTTSSIAPPASISRGGSGRRSDKMPAVPPLPALSEQPGLFGTGPGHSGRVPNPARSQTPQPGTSGTAPGGSGAPMTTRPAALPDPNQVAQAVFDAVNASRSQAGLRPLAWSSRLQDSAHQHNLAMAQANTLSHQLPGEPSLGQRESNAGVWWWWAGENIGETSSLTTQGALDLESAMVNEQPPNDGHRQNILSRRADKIGIDVVLDTTHHVLWLTEDFAQTSLL